MSKSNRKANSGHRTHASENEYKIPIKDRKKFMGNNKAKWVSEKKYKQYIQWRKYEQVD